MKISLHNRRACKVARSAAIALIASGAIGCFPATASAKVITVTVDAQANPWISGINRRLAFGLGDGKSPRSIFGARLITGSTVTFSATGSATWITGGERFGPAGDPSLVIDRSLTIMPAHYIKSNKPVCMLMLVGAFVDVDGQVVGEPFAIGTSASVVVPRGAVAMSLGINDDKLSDNEGSFVVTVDVPEAEVTVEPADPH